LQLVQFLVDAEAFDRLVDQELDRLQKELKKP